MARLGQANVSRQVNWIMIAAAEAGAIGDAPLQLSQQPKPEPSVTRHFSSCGYFARLVCDRLIRAMLLSFARAAALARAA